MLSFLPGGVRGVLGISLTLVNTLFWVSLIIPVAIIKFSIPVKPVRKLCNTVLNLICTTWANINKFNINMLPDIEWKIDTPDDLRMDKWYLVISNHQSWADILVLQYTLNDVIPYFRFFLKSTLKWFPLLNIAWWALDYPYMTRYSKAYLEKNPHMKGNDLDTTRKSCEKFSDTPVAIMNFVEGTRFRPEKRDKQNAPYKHLLRPSAGGIAFVIDAMGGCLTSILDVTIAYPQGRREIWDFLCGRVPKVSVKVRSVQLTDDIIGDYFNDENFKKRFQGWLNNSWAEKDRLLDDMLEI